MDQQIYPIGEYVLEKPLTLENLLIRPKINLPEGTLKSELEDEEQHGEDDDDACEDDLIGPCCETFLRLTIRGEQ